MIGQAETFLEVCSQYNDFFLGQTFSCFIYAYIIYNQEQVYSFLNF